MTSSNTPPSLETTNNTISSFSSPSPLILHARMPDQNPRKPQRLPVKRTGKRSPHFLQPLKGPARSSYFTVRRRPAGSRGGLKVKGRAGDAKDATATSWKEDGGGSSGYPRSFEGVVVVTGQKSLDRVGDCRDGWVTEVESKPDSEARRERRKRWKERKKRKKSRMDKRKKSDEGHKGTKAKIESPKVSVLVTNRGGTRFSGDEVEECVQKNPISKDLWGNAGFAVVIECRKPGPNNCQIKTEELDIKRQRRKRKRKRERRRKAGNDKVSTPIEQTGPPEKALQQSKKRKRSTTLEAQSTPPPTLPPETKLAISNTQPEGELVYHRNTVRKKRVRVKAPKCLLVDEDTLEARISRYWLENYQGKGNVRREMRISTDKHPPKTIISPSLVLKKEDKAKKLQTLDINTWLARARVSNSGPPPREKAVASVLPPRTPSQIFTALSGDDLSSKKVTPILPPLDTPRNTFPSSSAIAESYAGPSAEKLDIVLESTPKESAITPREITRRKLKKKGMVSKYFGSPTTELLPSKKESRNGRVPAGTSIIPWPPLTAEKFGLIQEELQNNTFHLIIATMFLNKIRGSVAIPLLRQFLVDYPTPEVLSQGDYDTITNFLWPLGLQRTRAKRLIEMAKVWLENPPTPGKGVKKYNYPARDTKPFNFVLANGGGLQRPKLGVEQGCEWEIAHLPGVGAYALDSWRIFCRDNFRKNAIHENSSGVQEEEWRRVVPKDKELRACLRWRWAKEGLREGVLLN